MPTVADPARPWPQRLRLLLALLTALALSTASHLQADQQRVTGANFKQAHKYSPEFLRPFIYSTAVVPNWIGKTDVFWYEYRTSKGRQFYRVNAQQATREPLFNNAKLATLLSEMTRKPLEPALLPLSGVSVGDDGNKMKFVTGEFRYEYDLRAEQLVKLGKAPVGPPVFGGSPEQLERLRQQLGDERFKQLMERQRELQKEDDEKKDKSDIKPPPKGLKGDYRAFSPDRKMYAFAREHNLFLAEAGKEGEAIQLTKDGAVDYSFGAASGGVGGKGKGKGGTRPFVSWSKDSKAFHVTRTDARGVEELFLVNPVAQPRPTLSKYKYPMPGEENIRRTELHVYHKATNKLVRVEPKWKDEAYTDIHWGKSSDELRFTRRDRLHRNAEFCSYNVPTGECRCLITDGLGALLPVRARRQAEERHHLRPVPRQPYRRRRCEKSPALLPRQPPRRGRECLSGASLLCAFRRYRPDADGSGQRPSSVFSVAVEAVRRRYLFAAGPGSRVGGARPSRQEDHGPGTLGFVAPF